MRNTARRSETVAALGRIKEILPAIQRPATMTPERWAELDAALDECLSQLIVRHAQGRTDGQSQDVDEERTLAQAAVALIHEGKAVPPNTLETSWRILYQGTAHENRNVRALMQSSLMRLTHTRDAGVATRAFKGLWALPIDALDSRTRAQLLSTRGAYADAAWCDQAVAHLATRVILASDGLRYLPLPKAADLLARVTEYVANRAPDARPVPLDDLAYGVEALAKRRGHLPLAPGALTPLLECGDARLRLATVALLGRLTPARRRRVV